MSRYPDWVSKYKKKGTVIKKVGESYYMYTNTSKYVKGKKYPQPVQHFIGIVTPNGVVESHKQKVSLTDIEVFEYGFSAAMLELCPENWKTSLKSDWYDVLCDIIAHHSPNSFILNDKTYHNEINTHHNLKTQEERMEEKMSMRIHELYTLKQIYVLHIDGKMIISKIHNDQKELISRLGITIGSEKG